MHTAGATAVEVSNERIASALDEIGDLLEVQGANVFRVRAYRNAARLVGNLGRSVAQMAPDVEALDALPGIGRDLAGKISEIASTGTCVQLESLRHDAPAGLVDLLKIPGLGPRRVQVLHDALGIATLQDLEAAAVLGRVAGLRGFSAAAEQRLLQAARQHMQAGRRFMLTAVEATVRLLLSRLHAVRGVVQAVVAGSYRRQRDTVGDIDLLATSANPPAAIAALVSFDGVARVLARGATRASVVLADGLQVDLRVVHPASFGAAWLYFTGSKAHNIALRRMAQAAGLKLNEYGLYRGSERIAGTTEASIYQALGLPFIEPELREDRGEIEAARAGTLPHLVQETDLRGDLHVHYPSRRGGAGLRALAAAAVARRMDYLAVTDRFSASGQPGCMDASALARRLRTIDDVNARLHGCTLLKGIEVEILENGSLDLPRGMDLSGIDLVAGVVQRGLDLPAARQTDRLLRAMDHPAFTLLAHPTHRLLLQREPSAIDLARVLAHAKDRGCFVELSVQPGRFDLDDISCRMARDAGVLVSISSEAQDAGGLHRLQWGAGQARRGWLEARHVLNARSCDDVRRLLGAAMGRPA